MNSAEPGDWRTDRVPFIRGILHAITDPDTRIVVLKKCAQVSYTEGVIGNTLGYHIHQRPCSMIVVQPSKEDAEDWSKDKLANLIEATPVLSALVADVSVRGGGSTILQKKFPGGLLKVVGGTSPKGLARTSAPVVFVDEADRLPRSAGKEGSPIDIIRKRVTTFWNATVVIGSTPTNEGESVIDEEFENTDQRRFFVPCPDCGERQVLRWGGRDEPYGLKWEHRTVGKRKIVDPESVYYLCEHCHCAIEEVHKYEMIAAGEWIATNPEGASPGVVGFHINALVSPFDGCRWPLLVQEFLDAGNDHDKLKVFVNTRLGEVWKVPGEGVTVSELEELAEEWADPDGNRIEVPMGAGVLTAAVDVQHDRLEVLVKAWGDGEESWNIAHQRIYGDPDQQDVWQRLEAIRTRVYRHEGGAGMRISSMGVDSGHLKNAVYKYVRTRQKEGVFALKGAKPEQTEPIRRSNSKNSDGVKLVTVGTVPMKDTLFARLKHRPRRNEATGAMVYPPGYIHFRRQDPDWQNGADAEFYAQFGRERRVRKKAPGGATISMYVKNGPNEAIDLEVYNLAALHMLGPVTRERLGDFARQVEEYGARVRGGQMKPAGQSRQKRRRVLSKGIR